jgi:hypothetical protein
MLHRRGGRQDGRVGFGVFGGRLFGHGWKMKGGKWRRE